MKNVILLFLAAISLSSYGHLLEKKPSSQDLVDLIKVHGEIDSDCGLELYANPYDLEVYVANETITFGTHNYYDNLHFCQTTTQGGFKCGSNNFTKWGVGSITSHHFICSKTSMNFDVSVNPPVLKFERIIYQSIMKDLADKQDCNSLSNKISRVEISQYDQNRKTIRRICKIKK